MLAYGKEAEDAVREIHLPFGIVHNLLECVTTIRSERLEVRRVQVHSSNGYNSSSSVGSPRTVARYLGACATYRMGSYERQSMASRCDNFDVIRAG